jgi:hypothetical protein
VQGDVPLTHRHPVGHDASGLRWGSPISLRTVAAAAPYRQRVSGFAEVVAGGPDKICLELSDAWPSSA